MKNSITIHVRDLGGKRHNLEVPTDMSLNLMEAIRMHELQIKATCGGMAMCASCHVIVLSKHTLKDMGDEEQEMLDEAFVLDVKGSRLSCQIPIREELDGLEVQLGVLTGE